MVTQLLKTFLLIGFCLALNVDAFAQAQRNGFTLEFNRSPAQAISLLEQRGFTDVKVIKRQLLALDIEACRQGVRYGFKLRMDGQIYDDRRLGSCTNQLTEVEVTKIATDNGFDKINVVEIANGFRVTACRTNRSRREQFTITNAGRIVDNRVLGPCETRVPFDNIAEDLAKRGLTRIELVSDQRRGYIISACRENRQVQLQVSFDGRVQSNRVTGRCRPAIAVQNIVQIVEKAGYERVVVTDKELPRYLVEACREGQRYEITLDRFGELREPRVIGKCRPNMNNDAITELLVKEGFYDISIQNGRRARFLAKACYANRKYEVDYSRYGDLVGERETGKCRRMNPNEMMATARARGAKGVVPQIKGCREGREVLYVLDRDGVIAERAQRGGRC